VEENPGGSLNSVHSLIVLALLQGHLGKLDPLSPPLENLFPIKKKKEDQDEIRYISVSFKDDLHEALTLFLSKPNLSNPSATHDPAKKKMTELGWQSAL
jgi:hypothetical protein